MELVIALILAAYLVAYYESNRIAGIVGRSAITVKRVAGIAVLVAVVLLSVTTGVLGGLLVTGLKLMWFALWVAGAAILAAGLRLLLARR